jgi:hypothetical protein
VRQLLCEPWDYELLEQDDGRLVLVVACGTVGVFEVAIVLDDAERRAFEAEGKPFIQGLKQRIVARPGDFQARNVQLRR